MNSIPKRLRFKLFALALTGVSIFIFVALISPYTHTRARLKLLQYQIRGVVAAERFLRYSALEVKEALDYGLIEESDDRKEELQTNAEHIERWRIEGAHSLSDLRSALEVALQTARTQKRKDTLLVVERLNYDYINLAHIEQRLKEMAASPDSTKEMADVVKAELIPLATVFSAALNQIVHDQVADMQSGSARLSGNLEGIVLYSGVELRARAEVMNETALKEVQAGLYVSLFTKALHNLSEFLLTQNPACVSKIRSLDQELQIIDEWKIADG